MTRANIALGGLDGAEEQGVAVFRGVPYAAPPVGALRFAPPQPAVPWRRRRDAARHGPIAPQAPSRLRAAMGDFDHLQDEDCLTLTIWTPAADAARRPVMVWLHGGAWISGAGSLDWYSGARLARDGEIVVVGVNHRLGALGYLAHPAISAGNLGTLDQVAALEWVRDHIEGLGGDPGCVTVVGQSAGASTIGRLLTTPETRTLLHRVVLQSGGWGRAPGAPDRAAMRAEQFMRWLEIDPDIPDARERLGVVPASRLVEAQLAVASANARFGDTDPPFGPILVEPTTPEALTAAIAEGADGLDVLIGATRKEGHAFVAPDQPIEEAALAARFAAVTRDPGALARFRARRPGGTPRDLLADLITETVFRRPAFRLAEAIAERDGRVFAYQFNWAPPLSPFKACHCIDIPFTFGNLEAFANAPMLAGGDAAVMDALSAAMRRAWIGFIRDGDPAHDALPDWSRYELPRRCAMSFDTVTEVIGDPAQFG